MEMQHRMTVRRAGLSRRAYRAFHGISAVSLLLLALMSALAFAPTPWSAPPATGHASAPPASAHLADLDNHHELEGFLDGVVTTQLATYHIPGATVSVVTDGHLSISPGIGALALDVVEVAPWTFQT